jgi:hypothetical protein
MAPQEIFSWKKTGHWNHADVYLRQSLPMNATLFLSIDGGDACHAFDVFCVSPSIPFH